MERGVKLGHPSVFDLNRRTDDRPVSSIYDGVLCKRTNKTDFFKCCILTVLLSDMLKHKEGIIEAAAKPRNARRQSVNENAHEVYGSACSNSQSRIGVETPHNMNPEADAFHSVAIRPTKAAVASRSRKYLF